MQIRNRQVRLNKNYFSLLIILCAILIGVFSSKQETEISAAAETAKIDGDTNETSSADRSRQLPLESQVAKHTAKSESTNGSATAINENELSAVEKISELEEKIAKFFVEVPNRSQLAGLDTSDVHDVPEQVKIAGAMLGEMREIFDSRPWPQNMELEFYLRCSQEENFFSSVKALCAARVSKIYFQRTGRHISPEIFDSQTAELKNEF